MHENTQTLVHYCFARVVNKYLYDGARSLNQKHEKKVVITALFGRNITKTRVVDLTTLDKSSIAARLLNGTVSCIYLFTCLCLTRETLLVVNEKNTAFT